MEVLQSAGTPAVITAKLGAWRKLCLSLAPCEGGSPGSHCWQHLNATLAAGGPSPWPPPSATRTSTDRPLLPSTPLPSRCVSALPAEEQRAPSPHCTGVPSLTWLPVVPAGHLTAALALLGLGWLGTPWWQPRWRGGCPAPAERLWPPPVETSPLEGKPAGHQRASWAEGEGCHYNSKAVYVQLPSIVQPQSQVLSFPLPGQACVATEENGHCPAAL